LAPHSRGFVVLNGCKEKKTMSKSRCLLALVVLGSITLVPVTSGANAIHPDPASICDHVAGNLVKNCGFETGNLTDWTSIPGRGSRGFGVTLFPGESARP
jgi:hypothetical protein